MINSLPNILNYQFKELNAGLVTQLGSIEGNGFGNPVLAILMDMALYGDVTKAASVSALATFPADTIALSTGDTYSDAAVNTAVNTALATAVSDINAIGTKVNAILTSLKNAGLMVSP